ncbi:hypothetical protein BDF14DRAFT_1731641 [Spinellus fusiger]|nr:hypothetical protein BDF14DRAFT_1731641 [Spinellus fusiger]
MLLVLSHLDVQSLLENNNTQTSLEIVDLMADTFSALSTVGISSNAHEIQTPHRISITTETHKVLLMPCRLYEAASVKVVSVPTADNDTRGLPAATFVLHPTTGAVEAILNAGALTAVRTAAGSALATRYYANPQAKTLVVMGAGAQGRAHIDMMVAIRPTLQCISIWNRNKERCDALVSSVQAKYPAMTVVSINEQDTSLQQAIQQADIICTCTNAQQPLLMGAWLKQGVHINCIGSYTLEMREVDNETISRVDTIIVDSVEACVKEAGDLRHSSPDAWIEIGQVVNDTTLQEKATSLSKISLFKSVGVSVQDTAIAQLIVKKAKQVHIGTSVVF